MDWQKEVECLNKGSDYLKLESGRHTIQFFSEGEKSEKTFEGDTPQKRVSFQVKYKGKDMIWEMSQGITTKSLYGQIALIGRLKGKLLGETITVLVTGNGKDKNYTIMEAIDLVKQTETGIIEENVSR